MGYQIKQTYSRRADDFAKMYIHPVIARRQMTVVGFAILQFD